MTSIYAHLALGFVLGLIAGYGIFHKTSGAANPGSTGPTGFNIPTDPKA